MAAQQQRAQQARFQQSMQEQQTARVRELHEKEAREAARLQVLAGCHARFLHAPLQSIYEKMTRACTAGPQG